MSRFFHNTFLTLAGNLRGLSQCSVRVSLGPNIVNWGAAVYCPWVARHSAVVGDPKPMFRNVAENEEQREKAPDG
jgi:hypothetical protein